MPLPTDAERAAFVAEAARRAWAIGGIPKLENLPELFFEPCPQSIYFADVDAGATPDSELHAIGVYEAKRAEAGRKSDPPVPLPIEVVIAPTERPVVLFLMSYDPVRWHLSLAEGSRLRGVYLSGHHPSSVVCPAPLEFVLSVRAGPSSYRIGRAADEDDGEDRLVERIAEVARLPLASFQGDYYGERYRVPCCRDAVLLRDVLTEHRSMLIKKTGRAPRPFWLVDGGCIVHHGSREKPIRPDIRFLRAVAHDEICDRFYAIDDHKLFAIERDGRVSEISPPEPDKFHWLGGVAIDSKRRRLVVSTLWHAGHHHLCDLATNRWETLEIGDDVPGGIHALAYEPRADRLLGIAGADLVAFTPDLRPEAEMPGSEKLELPDFMWKGSVQLAAFPEGIAIVLLSREEEEGFELVHRIEEARLVDLRSQDVRPLELDLSWHRSSDGRDTANEADLSVDGTFEYERTTGHYSASIGVDGLRRDAPRALAHLAARTEGMKTLIAHGRHTSGGLFTNPEHYIGLLASIEESKEPDWSERLARSLRELDAPTLVESDHADPSASERMSWTPQAREDLDRIEVGERAALLEALEEDREWEGAPMEGPFERLRVRTVRGWKVLYELRDGRSHVAYLRPRGGGTSLTVHEVGSS